METIKQYWNQIYDFLLENKQLTTYVFYGLLFVGAAWLGTAIIFYIKENHLFGLFIAKLTGNISKRDEIRRKNISADIKHKKSQLYEVVDSSKKQNVFKRYFESYKKKINSLIFYTGLLNIPGFSTTTMFVLLTVFTVFTFIIVSLLRGIVLGFLVSGIIVFFFFYGLSIIKYKRKNKLESQLLQFISDITSASAEYINIIDIFGAIYENYTDPLKSALEVCYVEAKRIRDSQIAMEHLKEKFDSMQFNFIIDNFILCSKTTNNFTEVSINLADTVTIYNTSFEKKKAITRNAKIELIIMFFLTILILLAMGTFLTNLYYVLFSTTFGNVLLLILVFILFFGMNIKGERI